MKRDNIGPKLIAMALLGGLFFLLSLLVLNVVNERENSYSATKEDVAATWGKEQRIIGPVLVSTLQLFDGTTDKLYVLPETVKYETTLEPEVRSRGIYDTIVYTSKVKVSGTFSASALSQIVNSGGRSTRLAVAITDTRGIEKQFNLTWNGSEYLFAPGSELPIEGSSGLHTSVPVSGLGTVPFSFEMQLKGTESIDFAPIGQETSLSLSSSWPTPKFSGSFLPTTREITADGFTAEWKVSSFGRSYPQSWRSADNHYLDSARNATMGTELHQQVDFYTQVTRSVKYAILFIVITFAAFFLFEVLAGLRIHPIQYGFIGAGLALFYLLLLSLAERLGFSWAYLLATAMIVLLITAYSIKVLQQKRRAFSITALLIGLYGYLYFVLRLEDLALLFGSLALFVLLAAAMYITRNVNWFEIGSEKPKAP